MAEVIRDTIYMDRMVENPEEDHSVDPTRSPSTTKPALRSISTEYLPDRSVIIKDVSEAPNAERIAKSFGNSPVDLANLEQFKVNM